MNLNTFVRISICTFPLALLMIIATPAQGMPSAASAAQVTPYASSGKRDPATLLHSRADLDTWLGNHAGQETPFDRMPAGARLRFMASLVFTDRGLIGFDPTELGSALSPADIRTVLALFMSGPELDFWADRIDSSRPGNIQTLIDAPMSPIETRYNQLYLLNRQLDGRPDSEHGHILAARYAQLFADTPDNPGLRAVNDYDLRLLYRAAYIANFYSPDVVAGDMMARTVAAMDARGIASPDEIGDARNALLAARRFDAARRFTHEHASAHLPPLPRFKGADADLGDRPSMWQYDDANDTLTRVPLDLAPLQILVLAGCHVSVDAANDITADPKLGPLFQRHARWLSLPPGNEDVQSVRDWNREHPKVPMEMLYARSEWPMFSHWAMPTFYIVQDGKMIGSVRGWSPASRDALATLLRRTGLLPPDDIQNANP